PSLAGRRLVITAGPTVEELDPVRFLGNRSSGKMGFALAERAAALGARVTLIAGPVALGTPRDVTRIDVQSAQEMREALWRALGADLSHADALIMAAAVADYRPAERTPQKIKRSSAELTLKLTPNPDLLAEIGAARTGTRPLLVGFALETNAADLVGLAREKLTKKSLDLVVANLSEQALGRDDTSLTLVGPNDSLALPELSKRAAAERILSWLHGKLTEPT
ncbi:MAG TPA: phosphopantothenoylcysteine decarboxylase, partial [Polyangiaceae bacterium]